MQIIPILIICPGNATNARLGRLEARDHSGFIEKWYKVLWAVGLSELVYQVESKHTGASDH
jgi:hypothetical protein